MSTKNTIPAPRPSPPSLLPRRSSQDGALFYVIAIIIFLACISALMARAAFVSAADWRTDLNGAMTVQIKSAKNLDSAANRAAALLQNMPGISAVRIHNRAYAKSLLEPWLGAGNIPDDLPLPVILAVKLDNHTPVTKSAISEALKNAGIRAEVDDHQRWSKQLNRAARFMQIFSIAALSLLASAALAVTGFATRANLAARRDAVNTLHLAGAFDSFIAGQFQRRFGALGLRAGLIGAALAGLSVAAAALLAAQGSQFMLPVFRLDLAGLAMLALAPVLSALACALTARFTVLSSLREQE